MAKRKSLRTHAKARALGILQQGPSRTVPLEVGLICRSGLSTRVLWTHLAVLQPAHSFPCLGGDSLLKFSSTCAQSFSPLKVAATTLLESQRTQSSESDRGLRFWFGYIKREANRFSQFERSLFQADDDRERVDDEHTTPRGDRENPRTSEKPVSLRLRALRHDCAVRAAAVASRGAAALSSCARFPEKRSRVKCAPARTRPAGILRERAPGPLLTRQGPRDLTFCAVFGARDSRKGAHRGGGVLRF